MRPSFHPRLVNDPFGDPGVFVPFAYENRALLFDLGDLSPLSARDVLKITHVFVTHTHMDHFIGFDRLLRLHLPRNRTLHLYGPEGFLKNVEGKLAGYTWNLLDRDTPGANLTVTEVLDERLRHRTYPCRRRFAGSGPAAEGPFDGRLHGEASFSVSAAVLDHGIPCLGFRLAERFHVNIVKDRVAACGWRVGPWLGRFKQALFEGKDPDTPVEIPARYAASGRTQQVRLGPLTERIARITAGQRMAYIADTCADTANEEKIAALAQGADRLFIEAAFLDEDRRLAEAKHHLTARQAGRIAGRCGAKQLTVFHFSPRYTDQGHLVEAEARRAFEGTAA